MEHEIRKAHKLKLQSAAINTPKPGEKTQLYVVVDEVVALMPGDKLLLKFDPNRKTFAGMYILDVKEA